MNLRHHFWVLAALLTVALCAATATARHVELDEDQLVLQDVAGPLPAVHRRSKRAFADFFTKLWTVGSLGKAQYDDTRTTLAKIYEILRDSFSDTMVRKTVSTVWTRSTYPYLYLID